MKTLLFCLLCASGCGPMAVAENDEANTVGSGGTTGVALPPPQLTLTVTSLEPAQPVEERPLFVRFRLSNSTGAARQGFVQLTLDPGGDYEATTPLYAVSVGARQSVNGMVEIQMPSYQLHLPYPYVIHYYDLSAPTTPAEANDTSGVLPTYIPIQFQVADVAVSRTALTTNDLTVQIDADYDDTLTQQATTLPGVRAGTVQRPGLKSTVYFETSVDGTLSFDAHLQWGDTATLDAGDSINDLGDIDRVSFANDITTVGRGNVHTLHFGTTRSALNADTSLAWISPAQDTVPLLTYFAQLHSGWGVTLSNCTGLNAQIVYGGGTVESSVGLTYVAPTVSVPTEVKLLVSDATRTSTVYVEVLP